MKSSLLHSRVSAPFVSSSLTPCVFVSAIARRCFTTTRCAQRMEVGSWGVRLSGLKLLELRTCVRPASFDALLVDPFKDAIWALVRYLLLSSTWLISSCFPEDLSSTLSRVKRKINRPGGTAGWLWNLRSEWTTWRPPYPSCTGAYPALRLSAQDRTLPDVRSRRTARNGGTEPAKRATNPRAVLPQRDPSARKVPRSGPTSQLKGRLNPSDSDRLPPKRPGS
jgi:hypothetical protein